jgi:hypothetical protein
MSCRLTARSADGQLGRWCRVKKTDSATIKLFLPMDLACVGLVSSLMFRFEREGIVVQGADSTDNNQTDAIIRG